MKTRFGFVSNSSSTSFIVGLPKNYNPTDDEILITAEACHYSEVDISKIRNRIISFQKGFLIYDMDDNKIFYILSKLFKPFVILEIDSGPDEGVIANIFNDEAIVNKIKKIVESY